MKSKAVEKVMIIEVSYLCGIHRQYLSKDQARHGKTSQRQQP